MGFAPSTTRSSLRSARGPPPAIAAAMGEVTLDDIAKCSMFVLMNATDPRVAMLAQMGACAYRLGLAFAAEAERARTTADSLQYVHLFDRCFFAVRVGIALELRLRREAGRGASGADSQDREDSAERDPPEDERAERPEHEGSERLNHTERDRDREAERASLPLLLGALEGVAADAAALPGPPPAALPTLRELLVRFSSDLVSAPRPGERQALRARLTGSATAFAAGPAAGGAATLSAPRPPVVGATSRPNRATGPPPG
jgi:hypothetical protein